MSKVLFIFEGEKIEENFFKLMNLTFKNESNKREMVCFKDNIYSLYKEIKEDNSLDLIELLKTRALDKKLNRNKVDWYTYSILEKNKFTEIYLIFDLDPQDSLYSINTIKDMIKLFDNETEHGKLYINYPMFESIKHFEKLPDPNYNNYKVDFDDCSSYKNIVSQISCRNDIKKITFDDFKIIILQNLSKIEFMLSCGKINNYQNYQLKSTQENIFNSQIVHLLNREVMVLNTICFWYIDYYGEKVFKKMCN